MRREMSAPFRVRLRVRGSGARHRKGRREFFRQWMPERVWRRRADLAPADPAPPLSRKRGWSLHGIPALSRRRNGDEFADGI